ncbi:methionyl-tRNA formyltransferase [Erythrobacter sp.]|jgi:methionyl-tRNA formyltransferase|uniref:methionyl-tRNA formyltransferase n=1 Tax=Erythrobacter sp. TaxID=1042 RepID=UPI002EA13A6E|nr:methionyl-tRNA formyltransferase [Erythrobacter sp.]
MRIIFMGTPDFAVPALVQLHGAGHDIACVYSQPPSRSGRGKVLRASPVHARAEALGLEVRTPKSLRNEDAQAAFTALKADIAVVAAYGLILPRAVLEAPRHGCLNIHASILPRWRGAAPIHRAVMAGDEETGATIMRMEEGLDTGPMLHIVRTPIGNKTTGELTAELAELGAGAMVEVLANLEGYEAQPQDDALATYAPKIDKAEARIDWSRPAGELVRHVAGLAPFPGAWFEYRNERIKLLLAEEIGANGTPGEVLDEHFTIACGEGALCPSRLQRAGKPAMDREAFLRGRPVEVGTVLK